MTLTLAALLSFVSGAQGPADGHSSPKHSGGTVQPAAFPGAGTFPVGEHLHAGVWRPQD